MKIDLVFNFIFGRYSITSTYTECKLRRGRCWSRASCCMSVVSALDSQFSDLGFNPSRGLADCEWDDNALKAFLLKPSCGTCKKEQASIKLQIYRLWKPRSINQWYNLERWIYPYKPWLQQRILNGSFGCQLILKSVIMIYLSMWNQSWYSNQAMEIWNWSWTLG